MRHARPGFFIVQTQSFTIFNGQISTRQQSCQKDCAEALCSNGWFFLLESRLVEPKDALERCGCLVYCVHSTRSNSTGSVLQRVFPTGCRFSPETGQQWFGIFYRSGFTEFEDGPNTKNVPNICA